MKCLQVLSISPNPSGLFALSSEGSSYLAFPTGSAGGVVLYDCLSLRLLSQIDAHKNSVASMTFNRSLTHPLTLPLIHSLTSSSLSTGTIFATASVSGTVVRLFSIPSGSHICTFRRGSRPADIHCLSFSNDSSLLVACSSSGTVHIFDVYSALHSLPSLGSETKQLRGRSQSMDSNGSSSASEGRANSWTSSAYTYLSIAQSWGTAAVSGLNVLPLPLQEYADSIRCLPSLSLFSSNHLTLS
jgi:autophagy-related protein 18